MAAAAAMCVDPRRAKCHGPAQSGSDRSPSAAWLHLSSRLCTLFPPILHRQINTVMPSHKSLRIKKVLGKKAKQNRPIPYWIRFRTSERFFIAVTAALLLAPSRSCRRLAERAAAPLRPCTCLCGQCAANTRSLSGGPGAAGRCRRPGSSDTRVYPVYPHLLTRFSPTLPPYTLYNRQQDPLQRQAPPLAPHQARHLERRQQQQQ